MYSESFPLRNNKPMEQIKKLQINLFPSNLKEKYNEAKLEWQADKDKTIERAEEYIPGGFMSSGYYTKRPDLGKIEADKWYGKEFDSFEEWSIEHLKLNSRGQQDVINKINEIIEVINQYIKEQ